MKTNLEIRDYIESVFFGLSILQFIFSVFAVLVAVELYFLLKPGLGMEILSWVCTLGAAPFVALGFFKYHGMTAEQVLDILITAISKRPQIATDTWTRREKWPSRDDGVRKC